MENIKKVSCSKCACYNCTKDVASGGDCNHCDSCKSGELLKDHCEECQ